MSDRRVYLKNIKGNDIFNIDVILGEKFKKDNMTKTNEKMTLMQGTIYNMDNLPEPYANIQVIEIDKNTEDEVPLINIYSDCKGRYRFYLSAKTNCNYKFLVTRNL